jgi:hypothetical protein
MNCVKVLSAFVLYVIPISLDTSSFRCFSFEQRPPRVDPYGGEEEYGKSVNLIVNKLLANGTAGPSAVKTSKSLNGSDTDVRVWYSVEDHCDEIAAFSLATSTIFGVSEVPGVHIIDLSYQSLARKFDDAFSEKEEELAQALPPAQVSRAYDSLRVREAASAPISQYVVTIHDLIRRSNDGANGDDLVKRDIVKLCLDPVNGVFDLSNVSAVEKGVFYKAVEGLTNSTSGRQRLLALIIARALSSLCPEEFPGGARQIHIEMNSKDTVYNSTRHTIYIQFGQSGGQLLLSLFHELSHALHYMILQFPLASLNMGSFVHFATSTQDLRDLYFPMFRVDVMDPIIRTLEQSIRDTQFNPICASFGSDKLSSTQMLKGDDCATKVRKAFVNLLLMGFGEVIFEGSGVSLRQFAGEGVSIVDLFTKSMLAKIVYMSSFMDEKGGLIHLVWPTLEEVLTVAGAVPVYINGEVVFFVDRQCERVFNEMADVEPVRRVYIPPTEESVRWIVSGIAFFGIFGERQISERIAHLLDPNKVFSPLGAGFPVQEELPVQRRGATNKFIRFLTQCFRGSGKCLQFPLIRSFRESNKNFFRSRNLVEGFIAYTNALRLLPYDSSRNFLDGILRSCLDDKTCFDLFCGVIGGNDSVKKIQLLLIDGERCGNGEQRTLFINQAFVGSIKEKDFCVFSLVLKEDEYEKLIDYNAAVSHYGAKTLGGLAAVMDVECDTALHPALFLLALLTYGYEKINFNNPELLFSLHDYPQIAKRVLADGKVKFGVALERAIRYDSISLFDFLVETGDLPQNPMSYSGDPWAHFVVKHKPQLWGYFLSRLDVNAANSAGQPLLYYVVQQGELEILRALLKYPDINLELTNAEGLPVVHYAVQQRKLDALRALLGCGRIDLNLKDRGGLTAYDYANRSGEADIVALFDEAMSVRRGADE